MRHLSRNVLPDLPQSVGQPKYDRESLKIGMAHIGVGAFHRCHQAEFIGDMLEACFGRWGVMGINLMAPSLPDLLIPQDCLYSRMLRRDACAETRIIGALRQVIDVTDKASADRAVAAPGSLEISVVTTTVTEKGYCLTPSTGALEGRVTFPSTMVDRIVPATEDVDKVSEALGASDPAVVGEPFRQCVIENKFAGERLWISLGRRSSLTRSPTSRSTCGC